MAAFFIKYPTYSWHEQSMPYVTEKIATITVNPITLRPERFVKKDSNLMTRMMFGVAMQRFTTITPSHHSPGAKCLSLQHFYNAGQLLVDICPISLANG